MSNPLYIILFYFESYLSMKNILQKTFACALIAVQLVSCSSTTLIKTKDAGVDVYIDDSYYGKTPVAYSDTKIVGSATSVKLKKPGCQEDFHMMNKNEEFQVGPCIGGFLVLVPFLWIMGYKAERTYEYECTPQKK